MPINIFKQREENKNYGKDNEKNHNDGTGSYDNDGYAYCTGSGSKQD